MKYSFVLALVPLICLVGASSAFNFPSSANITAQRDEKCKNVIFFKTNSRVQNQSMKKVFWKLQQGNEYYY